MQHDIEALKREAKRIARATTITHMQALDVLAVQRGHAHWGSLASTCAATPSTKVDIGAIRTSPTMIERLLGTIAGHSVPALDGCRHLIVCGSAATGKTTLIGNMIRLLRAPIGVVAVEECPELALPPTGRSVTIRGLAPRDVAEAFQVAPGTKPDLLVCEFTTETTVPIVEAMGERQAPPIVAVLHASRLEEVRAVVAHRLQSAHRPDLDLPVAVAALQLVRDPFTGGRRITAVAPI